MKNGRIWKVGNLTVFENWNSLIFAKLILEVIGID